MKYTVILYWSLSILEEEDQVIECHTSPNMFKKELKKYITNAFLAIEANVRNGKVPFFYIEEDTGKGGHYVFNLETRRITEASASSILIMDENLGEFLDKEEQDLKETQRFDHHIPLVEFSRLSKKPLTKLRQLASQCFDKQENYYQKALEYRLRKYNVKHEHLSRRAITDLSNEHNLIEIKNIRDLDTAHGQINRYATIMNSKGFNDVQKVIFVFGKNAHKKRYSNVASFENDVERFWREDQIHLIFASDPIDYLEDYEKAMKNETDEDGIFVNQLSKLLIT